MWTCRCNHRREEDYDDLKRIAELEADYKTRTSQLSEVTLRMRELEAENAELRKDAARYRWLRDSESLTAPSVDLARDLHYAATTDSIDAAIDAAKGDEE
jgi:hypothetical protein